jgi:outer membrane usher protein FimD/PapC
VPNLLSYYGNRVGIGAADVPLDYSIDATEKVFAPPYWGGSLVTFPVRKSQSFTGMLVVEVSGISVVPAYGQITVTTESTPVMSPLGKGGILPRESDSREVSREGRTQGRRVSVRARCAGC